MIKEESHPKKCHICGKNVDESFCKYRKYTKDIVRFDYDCPSCGRVQESIFKIDIVRRK